MTEDVIELDIYELIRRQEERLRNLDRIETCDYSLLPVGRLWCSKRKKGLVRAYCQTCGQYGNEELGIGV